MTLSMSVSGVDGGISAIAATYAMSSGPTAVAGGSARDRTVMAAAVDAANQAVQVAALAQSLGIERSLLNIVA